MKKPKNIIYILLVIYIVIIAGIYIYLVYPALAKPKGLAQTKVPSLSVTQLKEADGLLSTYGKVWVGYPEKPDLSKYVFGQTNPI